ncbi:MAG: glutamine amidotransferase [Rubripirellula sp.]
MTSFAFEPIYGSLLLAMLIAAVTIAVVLIVTPPTDNTSHRRWLIGLRLLAASILLLSLLRPALLRTDNRPADASLVVAIDTSRSMTLPDGSGGERWSTQVEAWRQLSRGVGGLESLEVRLLSYDSTVRSLPTVAPESLDGIAPVGEMTDLAAAALATIQAAKGQPIAGVVLMGDGTNTAPLQGTGAQRVVETLDSLGVPFWTVPIGPPSGQSASRDAAIDSLSEHYQLFAGNQVDIDFQLISRGLAGISVPLTLTWIDQEGKATEIATRSVNVSKANEVTPLSVSVRAPAPGAYRLRVEARKQNGELVTTNNFQTAFVDVREGGGRVLYLEGTLRQEQSYLRRSLRRFQDLDLTYRWIPEDTSKTWPVDFSDWFQPGKFDVYIIGDLDASALGPKQLGELAEAVSAGAGVITLGGRQSYGAGGYATTSLAEVLPIRMDAARRKLPGAIESKPRDQLNDAFEIQLARRHPITDLGGDDPSSVWAQLPKMPGANRLIGAKVAPGVQKLLQTPDELPLLVVGEYGRGRTAALAIDSTWRWWRGGKPDAHRRFWRQLVLWLLAREESGGDKIMIEMDARRFSVDQPPAFSASIATLQQSAANTTLIAEVVDAEGQATPVDVSSVIRSDNSAQETTIRGSVPKLKAGFYRLRVRSKIDLPSLDAEEMAFQVVDDSRELARPMADPVYLRQLAALTADHGGAAFDPEDINDLIETIKQRRRKAETPIVEKFRLGDGPISGWILFAIFTGSLSTEWWLRRRWGLV